ncbi:M48 family metalloprotease [Vulcanisaeta thermophila]|uniref:M48 family metalloprotease n=1 Tax=Vulcanisaeta thermophila TaxID=867917 RepID=UPI000852E8D7|nr:M48 family metalloprotease [Vulcanisaeta thermophila]
MFIPQFWLSFFIGLAFDVLFYNMFRNGVVSLIVSLLIIALTLVLVRRDVAAKLRELEHRENYYVADDSVSTRYGGKPVLNACVPIAPGINAIVISRSFINVLSNDELLAVIKHEEGHIKYNHVKMLILALMAFYLFYYEAWLLLEPLLASDLLAYPLIYAVGVFVALILIHTFMKQLESEADALVVTHGMVHAFKRALSKVPERGGLARLFDPHPIRGSRPVSINVDSIPWHLKVLAPYLALLVTTLSISVTEALAHVIPGSFLALFAVLFASSAFILLLLISYIGMLMYKAVGIGLSDARVILMLYYLLSLLPFLTPIRPIIHVNQALYGAYYLVITLTSPLIMYRDLGKYLRSLIPFVIIYALNLALILILHGFYPGFMH